MANDHIDITVEPGEVHALLGENGAGKSTLMNQLYGLLQPDEGEILVDGEAKVFRSPRDAIAAGIGMVHQHFMLVPVFTVAENIALGAEETKGGPLGWLDRRRSRRDVLETSERYGLPVDPDALVENLPVGAQQRVEIVKALTRDVDLLILDEPTAVLTPQETEELLTVMRSLSDAGKSIVFITHKLKEVKAIADRITVIRRGRTVGPSNRPTTEDRTAATFTPDTPEDELASLMVGRSVSLEVTKTPSEPGREVLKISGVMVDDDRGIRAVDGVDLVVRAGEVLGVAGVQGNGQTELVEAVMGLRPLLAGTIKMDNEDLVGMTTKQILRSGDAVTLRELAHALDEVTRLGSESDADQGHGDHDAQRDAEGHDHGREGGPPPEFSAEFLVPGEEEEREQRRPDDRAREGTDDEEEGVDQENRDREPHHTRLKAILRCRGGHKPPGRVVERVFAMNPRRRTLPPDRAPDASMRRMLCFASPLRAA